MLVYAIARLNKRSSLHRNRSIESLKNKLSKPIKTASERRAYRSASWMPQHGRQYQRSSACRWRMGGIKSRLRCRCRDQRLNEPGTYCRMSNVRLLTRTVGEYSFAFGPQCMSPFSHTNNKHCAEHHMRLWKKRLMIIDICDKNNIFTKNLSYFTALKKLLAKEPFYLPFRGQ